MSAVFHRKEDGTIWFRAHAGGHGGGSTSIVDIPATEALKEEYARQYAALLAAERSAAQDAVPTEDPGVEVVSAEAPAPEEAAQEVPPSAA